MTLPAFAAERRAAALLLPGALHCRSISFARTALSSKPAARRYCVWLMGQTDWRTDTGPFYRPCSAYYAHSVKKQVQLSNRWCSASLNFLRKHVLSLSVFWRDYWKICWNMWHFVICDFSNVKWKITARCIINLPGYVFQPSTEFTASSRKNKKMHTCRKMPRKYRYGKFGKTTDRLGAWSIPCPLDIGGSSLHARRCNRPWSS